MTFEIIIQQQMQNELRELIKQGESDDYETEQEAVSRGWMKGMQIIQLISANARYFTDAATKPVLDVSAGDCGVGLSIDFYGLFQEENLRLRSGSDRFVFVMPKAGSAVSPDPISMFIRR
jgi:ABC-type Fe3+ transport system substrate-binding protein